MQPSWCRHGGIVDQYLDRTERLLGRVGEAGDRVGVAHVELMCERLAAHRANLGDGLLEAVEATGTDRDGPTQSPELDRDRAADPSACPRDHCHAALAHAHLPRLPDGGAYVLVSRDRPTPPRHPPLR